jgi:hypothetical protein
VAEGHHHTQRNRAAGHHCARGQCAVSFHIRLPDHTITAQIAAKSLRKRSCWGHLIADDTIAEAGLSAQPKAAKPTPQ